MKLRFLTSVVVLLLACSLTSAAEQADLLGKWALQEATAGMPEGTIWEFQKDGTLKMLARINGKDVIVDIKYELKGKLLHLELANGKKDNTELISVTKTFLVFRDNDGTAAIFKKAK